MNNQSNKPKKTMWLIIGVLSTLLLAIMGVQSILADPTVVTPFYLPVLYEANQITPTPTIIPTVDPESEYVVIAWNDLGMHCYDRDYSRFSILPPYNTVWAQVIQKGDPPQLITQGVTVEYSFLDNSESASKTNFWDYDVLLFGVDLPVNVGLTGRGLAGEMDADPNGGQFFIAEGIPVTEFSDSTPSIAEPFQLVVMKAKDSNTGEVLAQTKVVAPVSSEMRCYDCHNELDPTDFRLDILKIHDQENGTTFAEQAINGTPVLCAGCHADPALGMSGDPELPYLSLAIHEHHAEVTSDCYACHPGPETQCLRDVMSQPPIDPLWCTDCHGSMLDLGNETRIPWLNEPRCGNCHEAQFAENLETLYRFSVGHGGLYCEACHNSTHAILPSREDNDNLQSISLQGFAGTIQTCTVCHVTQPTEGGPHHE